MEKNEEGQTYPVVSPIIPECLVEFDRIVRMCILPKKTLLGGRNEIKRVEVEFIRSYNARKRIGKIKQQRVIKKTYKKRFWNLMVI